MEQSTATIGILTVSDRAFNGTYEDRGGPAIKEYLDGHFQSFTTTSEVVPDEQPQIQDAITKLASSCCLILTTGGTGPAPRDVTPEATAAVCQKMMPGFGEIMRAVSYKIIPTAILSRQTAGICNASLVINLPGNPKAITECLDPVLQAIPHAVRLAGGDQTVKMKPEYHQKGRNCAECNVVH